ncbi:hypothetical protein HanIR_Chr08g0349821 [Helianthus annuus]|nr:hypothetical protein HanIR_Chr08g0349821 [Helianthus annuus]
MAVSISVLVAVVSLHLMAFVLAIGAERRRSTAKVRPDQYDDTVSVCTHPMRRRRTVYRRLDCC